MPKQKAEREKRFELQKNDIDALSFDSSNELELIKKVALEYEGDLTRLGSAFGCLFMCKIYGYILIRNLIEDSRYDDQGKRQRITYISIIAVE